MKTKNLKMLSMRGYGLTRIFCTLLFLLGASSWGYAQQLQVSGKVLEKGTEIPVPGAAIVEDGTNNGVVTDFDGNFTIELTQENASLRVSFLGFKTELIAVKGESNVTIYMEESGQQLDEVVIIGYGAQKRTDVTGAVANLKAEEFNKGVVNAPEELLQAKVAGVRVTTSSGEPGAATTVTIRGAGALRSGDSPLYVIDGVPISNAATSPGGSNILGSGLPATSAASNPIAFLNPNDIASMDVLKDASATAIYGSRGANGVILITTKRGKGGKSKIDFNHYTAFSKIANKLKVGTAQDFGGGAIDTDWQDQIFRTGITKNYGLTYSTSGEKSSMLVSLSAFDQEGIIEKSGLKRYTGRLNTSFFALEDNKLKIDFNLIASQTENNSVPRTDSADTTGELITNTLGAVPTRPVLDASGNYSSGRTNPVGLLASTNDITETNRFLSNLTATYRFSPNFNYQVNLGADYSNGKREQELIPNNLEGVANNGTYAVGDVRATNLLFENFLTYNLTKGDNNFNFLLGYANQSFELESTSNSYLGFVLPNVSAIDNPTNAPLLSGLPRGTNSRTILESVFGRINYSYGDRLDVSASLRADGTSKFAKGNKWGVFPALAASYALINNGDGAINTLKTRVGWGQTGNQNVPGNPTQDAFEYVQLSETEVGVAKVAEGNPDLEWEISNQFNIGVDFSMLNNRLYGSLDYFNKVNEKMILFVASEPPAVSGEWINLPGDITNSGLEAFVSYDVVKSEDFNWTLSANGTYISNEVNLRDGEEFITGAINGPGLNGSFVQVVRSGEALGSFLLPTANADGTVSEESTIQGSGIPNFVYGFNTSLNYKRWDFSMNFSGVSGNKIYNNTAQFLNNVGDNVTRELLTETNDIPPGASDYYLEDGSFLRLANTTLGYDFDVSKVAFLDKFRFYMTGQNLFTLTDYSGFDPEVNTPRTQNGILSYGIDFAAYPRARTLILGINASF
ncbi:TonB-dependent receptor domain-containing protein [Croceivirga sp. JEA036]|uniref:TonB-dependent receptor domain-containing protein n=1 Tax=Croceivirga sp. JEA036 TaxID=2721162 RepID=UPI00143C5EB6|nr:TonB-dependent receptor [Croceivirga sp. JEA036]NJB36477.1 TonB-dependent receptor [Croceivirga sp. JEA036]